MLIDLILYYFPEQVSVYGRFHIMIPITIIPKKKTNVRAKNGWRVLRLYCCCR